MSSDNIALAVFTPPLCCSTHLQAKEAGGAKEEKKNIGKVKTRVEAPQIEKYQVMSCIYNLSNTSSDALLAKKLLKRLGTKRTVAAAGKA